MRVGEKQRKMPALSPKKMRVTEDASREASTPFGAGAKPATNRLGQGISKTLKPLPVTSLNLGIGKQKRGKRND